MAHQVPVLRVSPTMASKKCFQSPSHVNHSKWAATCRKLDTDRNSSMLSSACNQRRILWEGVYTSTLRFIIQRQCMKCDLREGLQRYRHCVSVCCSISGPFYMSCGRVSIKSDRSCIYGAYVRCNTTMLPWKLDSISEEGCAALQVCGREHIRTPWQQGSIHVEISVADPPQWQRNEVHVGVNYWCLIFLPFQCAIKHSQKGTSNGWTSRMAEAVRRMSAIRTLHETTSLGEPVISQPLKMWTRSWHCDPPRLRCFARIPTGIATLFMFSEVQTFHHYINGGHCIVKIRFRKF